MRPLKETLKRLGKKEHMKMGPWDKGGFLVPPHRLRHLRPLGEALLSLGPSRSGQRKEGT